MVWGLVEERSRRAVEVSGEIAKGWGGQQVLNGPYLVVPYTVREKTNGKHYKTRHRHAIISPEKLEIVSNVEVEERKKSIYKAQLFHAKSKLAGEFPAPDFSKIKAQGGAVNFEHAFLAMSISDPTGFRSDINVRIDEDKPEQFLPGLNQMTQTPIAIKRNKPAAKPSDRGVHFPLKRGELVGGFKFNISLAINGSQQLVFQPAGKTTMLRMNSNWPHPGFDGQFLPEKREIKKQGFEASWTIPSLARGVNDVILSSALPASPTAMSVSFVEPLKFYQVTVRTLKYSIAFFALVFLAIFILELTGRNSFHWIQYILCGFALVIFYVMLLALAEQIGFGFAYFIAAAATTLLISWYAGDTLSSKLGGYVMCAVLGTTYLIMYLILNEEKYALLAGSLIAFVAIAATMIATRKVEWSSAPVKQVLPS